MLLMLLGLRCCSVFDALCLESVSGICFMTFWCRSCSS